MTHVMRWVIKRSQKDFNPRKSTFLNVIYYQNALSVFSCALQSDALPFIIYF